MFRPPAGDAQLRHGYTVSQVRALSLAVVTKQTCYQSVDFDQRLEVAWHAIIEHLYTSDQPPDLPAVARAAERAVGQDVQQMHRFYGRNTHDRYAGTIAGFHRYWQPAASPSPSPETSVIDRVALAQIWPRLRPEHQQVLTALTVHDDYVLAAEALGISRSWFITRPGRARREFLKLWHEGEPPSWPWAQDQRGRIAAADRLLATNRTIAARRRAREGKPRTRNQLGPVPGRPERPGNQRRRTGAPLSGGRVNPPARRRSWHVLQRGAVPSESRRRSAPPCQRATGRTARAVTGEIEGFMRYCLSLATLTSAEAIEAEIGNPRSSSSQPYWPLGLHSRNTILPSCCSTKSNAPNPRPIF